LFSKSQRHLKENCNRDLLKANDIKSKTTKVSPNIMSTNDI